VNRVETGKLNALKSLPIIEAQKKARVSKYNDAPNTCAYCTTALSYEKRHNKYCNHTCSAIVSNKKRVQKDDAPIVMDTEIKQCDHCDSELTKSYQTTFCSSECRKDTIEDKLLRGERCSPGAIRRYLFRTRPHECEICKGTEWHGRPMPLVMDHMDGNPTNDHPTNLRLICPNCDRFLPTFGNRNRGYGRKSRGIKRD
jgi:hypothetical protein